MRFDSRTYPAAYSASLAGTSLPGRAARGLSQKGDLPARREPEHL